MVCFYSDISPSIGACNRYADIEMQKALKYLLDIGRKVACLFNSVTYIESPLCAVQYTVFWGFTHT